jgi:hypothetical protein
LIYAVQAEGTEYVKIGYATNCVKSRVDMLQTGCPFKLKLIAHGDGDMKLEKRYHRLLKNAGLHYRGEWFKRGKELEKVIWLIRESKKMGFRAPITLPKQIQTLSKHRLSRALAFMPESLVLPSAPSTTSPLNAENK